MNRPKLGRSLALLIAAALLAAACVTITPVAHVASVPSASLATAAPTPAATAHTPAPSTQATAPPPSAAAAPTDTPAASDQPSSAPTRTPKPSPPSPTLDASDPACSDDAYTLEGFSWKQPYEWHYNSSATPGKYKSADIQDAIERGIANVTSERNDCGRPDHISALADYQGDTDLTPCTEIGDGVNVIAFGDIPSDISDETIAYTCPYTLTENGDISEADIVISRQIGWSMSKDACFFEELLEPTITHEMGHVLGLGHVSERQHPDLTMSTSSNGPCDDVESTLGLGDMLGLESLYPSRS